jgi:hypothetical protein
MLRALCVSLGLAALTLGGALLVRAQEGDKKAPDKGKAGPDGGKQVVVDPGGKRVPLDKYKLPPGAIIVLCDNPKEATQLYPRFFVLTPKEYQDLTDRIAALEKQLKPERRAPHTCKLTATARGDVLDLHADLYFTVEQPRTLVFLGFKGTQINRATLEVVGEKDSERPAALERADDGYTLVAAKPALYRLALRVEVPIKAGDAGERSFDLGLPGAAVTTLALDLANPVKEVRYNKISDKTRLPGQKFKHWEATLGKLTQLTVAWKEPPTLLKGDTPLPRASGQVLVKVEDKFIVTTGELTLQDLRGQLKTWQLWLPPGITDPQGLPRVTPPDGVTYRLFPPAKMGGPGLYKLVLDQETDEPIKVSFTAKVARGPKVGVGPFAVLEAVRQEGIVDVRATATARRGVRLQLKSLGELEERDPPKEAPPGEAVALFRYNGSRKQLPMLELELVPVPPRVETQVEHTVRLAQVGPDVQAVVTTRIHARPLHGPVDYLDVQLPPSGVPAAVLGGVPAAFPAAVPWPGLAATQVFPLRMRWEDADFQYLETDGKRDGRVRIRLDQTQQKEFTRELVGTYTLPRGARAARLPLPVPLTAVARAGEVKVEVEDRWELLMRDQGQEVPTPDRHQVKLRPRQADPLGLAPAFLDLAWRPYQPDLPVTVVTDVTLGRDSAHVRQQLEFAAPRQPAQRQGAPLRQVRVLVPGGVYNLEVTGGGQLPEKFVPGRRTWSVLLAGAAGGPTKVVLEYDFALPKADAAKRPGGEPSFEVPLLWPEQATRVDTKVRLWCDGHVQAALAPEQLADVAWRDLGTEVVPGSDRLPRRVLSSPRLNVPLRLRLEVTPPERDAIAERALIQVAVADDLTEHYRVRFLLTEVNASYLDLKLPVPLAGQLQVLLGQKRVDPQLLNKGAVARVPVDLKLAQPVILEVVYQLPRDHLHNEGFLQTGLHAPEFAGNVLVRQVRWQISLPGGWLPLVAGENAGPQQWTWRGGLLTPQPGLTSAQLEQWLTAPPSNEPAVTPSLVVARDSLQPLFLMRVPQQVWFVLCSGVLLLLGLGLNSSALSSYTAGLLLLVLGLGVVAFGLFLPAVLPVVLYGCEPGAAVLAVVLLVQWTLQERYRRQVVFMPGFQRLKPGSSLVRQGSAARSRDASTVDAPVNHGSAAGSSVGKGN